MMDIHPASAMAIYILLLLITCILLLGFFGVVNLLVEIRDAITASCADVKRLADELDGDLDDDEWSVPRGLPVGNPPFEGK